MANALQLIGGNVPRGLESPTKERKVIRIIDIVRKESNMNIQQLRAQIAALQDATMDENKNFRSAYDEGKFDALSAVDALLDSMQEEPVSKQNPSNSFNIGKDCKEEPVSEPNKELAETYLAVFNKKFPILPSLSGKQLADYKNFLNKCQQIFGLKEWGIRPIQSRLFEKLTLLWAAWGAEHLQGVGRQDEKWQDIPVSEDLEEYINELSKQFPEVSFAKLSRIAVRVAKWKEEQNKKKEL